MLFRFVSLSVSLNPEASLLQERRLRLAAEEKAEGEKILVIKAAEADAEAKHLAGVGLAKRRAAIISGLKESVREFCGEVDGTTPTEAMTLIMQNQHLDMLKEVGTGNSSSTVFVPSVPAPHSIPISPLLTFMPILRLRVLRLKSEIARGVVAGTLRAPWAIWATRSAQASSRRKQPACCDRRPLSSPRRRHGDCSCAPVPMFVLLAPLSSRKSMSVQLSPTYLSLVHSS